MNWLDILFSILLISSAISGLRVGFTKTVVGFASTVIAVVASIWFYGPAGALYRPYVSHPAIASILGFATVFSATLLLGGGVGYLLARFLKWAGLKWMDRILGAGLGIVRGTLISIALLMMINAFTVNPPSKAIVNSQIAPYLLEASNVLSLLAPRELRQGFEKNYEKVKKIWTETWKKSQEMKPEIE